MSMPRPFHCRRPAPAFAVPSPVAGALGSASTAASLSSHSAFTPAVCPSVPRDSASAAATSQQTKTPSRPSAPVSPVALGGWDLVRRAATAAGVAGALFVGGVGAVEASAANGGASPSRGRQTVVASANSDVEAAAVTLGAVTVGGLAVKAVLRAKRDPEKELKEVEEASALKQAEEVERARRLERRSMEGWGGDGDGDGIDDEVLMEDFLSRVASLGDSEAVDDGDEGADGEGGTSGVLREFPIPDRGASGSAVLERPDETADADVGGVEEAAEGAESDDEVDEDSLEMLKKMWSLDSPDEGERKKK